jgi:hypothetical protein
VVPLCNPWPTSDPPRPKATPADRLLTLERDRRRGAAWLVFVGSPYQARGRAFDVVFVLDSLSGQFPQVAGGSVLLDDPRESLDPSPPRRVGARR